MNIQVLNLLKLSSAFIALFGMAEYLFRYVKIDVEITRKIVHIGCGLLALSFPIFFNVALPVFILCGSFLLVLIFSSRFGFLPSINSVERSTKGSVLFPIAVASLFYFSILLDTQSLFYIPLLILAICDPIACVVGKMFPLGQYKFWSARKTLTGSIAFFTTAFIISFLLLQFDLRNYSDSIFFESLIVACCATIAEGLAGNGYDNITIPAAVFIVLCLI